MINTVLVDARNFNTLAPQIIREIQAAPFTGLDCETQDSDRHDGLNAYCKYREDGTKAQNTKLVFDMRRTTMTGFSVWPEGSPFAYYLNLAHADVENRLGWEKAVTLLDALPDAASWIAHNATYELTAFSSCFNYPLPRMLCTLQMAVSAYGPDEYNPDRLVAQPLGAMAGVLREIGKFSLLEYNPETREMGPNLSEQVYKIIAKEADSAHSYNGFVGSMAYGYGLKRAVEQFFGHKMTTFDQVLNGKAHMGLLTGEEVAAYGAEDAYWAVRLFRFLLPFMASTDEGILDTFLTQENPMTQVFADIWQGGMRVNLKAIYSQRDKERQEMADVLRELKATVRGLLPFLAAPHAGLMETDTAWYPNNHAKYRKQIETWAMSPDSTDAYTQCQQVRGPVSNAWADELGKPQPTGVNLSHYMPVRTLIYDLLQEKLIKSAGKTQSDGNARGRLKDRRGGCALIDGLAKIAGIEQRMKLYLTPYLLLCDPETKRMYPNVSSMLATRRMAASYPNPMQLAKRGASTYVRGFFLADEEDHVLLSIDWSAIELLIIGELSQDPEFIKAYGQLPHDDLHLGASADLLGVDCAGFTEDLFKQLKDFETVEEFVRQHGDFGPRLFQNFKGEPLAPPQAAKYWRTELGKRANFGYWYSGWLFDVGEWMGWSHAKTAAAVEKYRERFAVAEAWRVNTIQDGMQLGHVVLPDRHRRVRYEATPYWRATMRNKMMAMRPLNADNYGQVVDFILTKIQKRAGNQLVNAAVQGTCATIAKRSVLRINEAIRGEGYRARFLMPIHDELLFSVHRNDALAFLKRARGIMCDHPDLFKACKLDASPALGLTFEPWPGPLGQIELFEAPKLPFITNPGGRMSDDEITETISYLFQQRDQQK